MVQFQGIAVVVPGSPFFFLMGATNFTCTQRRFKRLSADNKTRAQFYYEQFCQAVLRQVDYHRLY